MGSDGKEEMSEALRAELVARRALQEATDRAELEARRALAEADEEARRIWGGRYRPNTEGIGKDFEELMRAGGGAIPITDGIRRRLEKYPETAVAEIVRARTEGLKQVQEENKAAEARSDALIAQGLEMAQRQTTALETLAFLAQRQTEALETITRDVAAIRALIEKGQG